MIPGSANPLLLKSAAAAGPVQIERSLRFNSADSAYLSRAPAVAGNRKTWTWSGWVKRSLLGSSFQTIFGAGTGGSAEAAIRFNSDDTLEFYAWTAGYNARLLTTQVFRDTSAWYHFVAVFDTPNATADQRIRLYVNGTEVTTFISRINPAQNYDGYFNNSISHTIGDAVSGASPRFFNGYLADIHFIDGQALTPSSFTEVSATTGQLIPKAYTGSFGTNGFWLKFSDNSAATAAALGNDYSGNNNDWTPNNLSVTAGAGNDSLVDTPTSYGTDTYVGGEVRGNYCVLNAVNTYGSTTLSNGNLEATLTTGGGAVAVGTIAVSSGKWYWEVTPSGSSNHWNIGIADSAASNKAFDGPNGWYYYADGRKVTNLSYTSYGSSFTGGDVIGVALDMDAGTVTFYKNNTSQGTAFNSGIAGKLIQPALNISATNSNAFIVNFGQRAFAYTAPSGFKALVDTNLGAPVVAKPSTVMDVKLYTGNGSTQTISGLGFSPDFAWFKSRSVAENHVLSDTVRGADKQLFSNLTNAEQTNSTYVTSFTSDGFSLGSNTGTGGNNINGTTYVAWAWDAGSSTVTNTQGSITSQVRANASAGFSIVTYTGTGSNATVGHSLNVTPSLVITKNRASVTAGWYVYHKNLSGAGYVIYLNSTSAQVSDSTPWNSTAPTSTVFSVGTNSGTNGNGNNMVAYCFAPVAGYSAMGSYVGNGSATDGPFVYTGFRPRWMMIKRTDSAEQWYINDAARDDYNVTGKSLRAQSSGAEASTGGSNSSTWDILSNGFKLRDAGAGSNASGGTYIYYAVAENPFQYVRAR